MKKMLSVVLMAALLVVGVCGCGQKSPWVMGTYAVGEISYKAPAEWEYYHENGYRYHGHIDAVLTVQAEDVGGYVADGSQEAYYADIAARIARNLGGAPTESGMKRIGKLDGFWYRFIATIDDGEYPAASYMWYINDTIYVATIAALVGPIDDGEAVLLDMLGSVTLPPNADTDPSL